MPRFQFFSRQKSSVTNADVVNAQPDAAPATPSFKVIPQRKVGATRSADGEVRATSGSFTPGSAHGPHTPQYMAYDGRGTMADADEDNMFLVLKNNDRGSSASNTTKTTSTETSSRRSNASTPPSSTADPSEEVNLASRKPFSDVPIPAIPKSSPASGFLRNAGRTLSFGQKKTASPGSPGPAVDAQSLEDASSLKSPVMTASTSIITTSHGTSTAPQLESQEADDDGGDFGANMFKALANKRSSMLMPLPSGQTPSRSMTENRTAVPSPLQINKRALEPPLSSMKSQGSRDKLLTGSQPSPSTDAADDEVDVDLLNDTILASRWLGGNPGPDDNESIPLTDMRGARRNVASSSNTDRSMPSMRPAHRFPPSSSAQPKVMTPAQFERYRQDLERQGRMRGTDRQPGSDDEDDDDKYDDYDDDDEAERSRQATRDRNTRQAHMTLYRQQQTRVTGETPILNSASSNSATMPGGLGSASTPNLLSMSSPAIILASEDEGDDDVPLAILQEHGFPSKTRPPMRPNNLRASYIAPSPPAQSSLGAHGQQQQQQQQQRNRRHSALPAFARNLPQDPFSGPGQAVRESLPYGGGMPATSPQFAGPGQPSSLVNIIRQEEMSRAMRRGSPQPQSGMYAGPLLGYDPTLQMPPQMRPMASPLHSAYGTNPMAAMSQPSLNQFQYGSADPAMQMQMMQMQMMPQQMVPNPMAYQQQMMQQQMAQAQMMPGGGGMAGAHLMPGGQMAIRHSVATDSLRERPRIDAGMRTMSMVQPSSASWVQPMPTINVLGNAPGYTASIAPSERSTVGMPGRYRPVSQLTPLDDSRRVSSLNTASHTMTGTLGGPPSSLSQHHSRSEPRLSTMVPQITLGLPGEVDGDSNKSDDEDEAWAALKAKREKTRSMWKKNGGAAS